MGVGYSRNLVQWSKGEYLDANRTQDDLQIITTQNGFTYRADDHGSHRLTATPLSVTDPVALGLVYQVESCVDLTTQPWDPITGELVGMPVLQPDGLTEQVIYRFTFPDSAVHLRLHVDLPSFP